MISLYDFQERAVEALRENIRQGVKNQVLSAPTGSGKTEMALHLISECHGKGKRAVFVCDRTQLIDQTSARMDRYGIPHGVIQAQHWRWRPWERVQVASAQTLARRKWPESDLIVVDEAHTFYQSTLRRIGARECVTIGLTATPFTRGMGQHYDRVVSVTTTRELIERQFLAPYEIYAASEPDMEGAKVVGGEWTDSEAERRSLPIVGDCVAEYLKHGRDRKFICFGVTIAHCEELRRQFLAAGVQASLYTAHTPNTERQELVTEFRSPDSYIRGLVSVAALAKGFDVEGVGVVILARPLRNGFSDHIQMIGRGLRKDPANPDKLCTILDHAGNCVRFWDRMNAFFDEGAHELDDGRRKPKAKPEKKPREPRKCPACKCVHAPRPTCPTCGFEYPRRSNVEQVDGTLVGIGSGAGAGREERRSVHAQLLWIARERGYASGWAAWSYKERFGSWPPRISPDPLPPTSGLLRWVRSRQIRHAKRRKSA